MAVTISGVEEGSVACGHGVCPGHKLVAVDGHPIRDVLDYRFYTTEPRLCLELEDEAGAAYTLQLRKPRYDDLGLQFDTYLMDRQQRCKNRCVFCFIDQLPPGLRDTLYFKDDDSRMSFLFGNYITLTNLEEEDVERIIKMRISPVNISVHTTDPDLRVKMMKNPSAGHVLRYLPRLAGAGIQLNAQLVLCPGINDGAQLDRSLADLTALAPNLGSVAAVPVGLTKFREGLTPLRLFNRDEARRVVDTVESFAGRMLEAHGARICHAADEFYLCAGRPVPPADHYGDFAQLENGVGLLALLEEEFTLALKAGPGGPCRRSITVATGKAAQPLLSRLSAEACKRFPGLSVEVVAVENDFFGPAITVAGLVTGGDLTAQLSRRPLGDRVLIPAAMLRREGDLFLDSVSLQEVERALGRPVIPVGNDGQALLDALLGRGD